MTATAGPPSGLVDARTVTGLLLGPAIGAVVEVLLARASHGGELDMGKSLLTYLTGGYALLPALAAALLLLRWSLRDSLLACATAGFAIGLAYFAVISTSAPSWGQYVFQGGLPFALMLVAARLIAGRRA